MEFVGRESELKILGDHVSRPGPAMFVLYGRRRIGKTALIERLLETTPGASYHVGTRSAMAEEMRRLSATLARDWDVPMLAAQPMESSAALMSFLTSMREPRVLVLDEFPYLQESDPSLAGQIQAAWDSRLSRSDLKLLFCGSSVGMMEDVFFSRRSPLFGRRTGQLRLGPLAPHHVGRAFGWKTPETVELYALFGGIPGYLTQLDPDLDLLGNLAAHVLRIGEPLYEEVPFLLRDELREPRVYHAVLATIAAGTRKFGQISSKVGLDRANLTRYLSVLSELSLVEREVSVLLPRPEKSRKGLYRVSDPFVAAWFTLVHPYRDHLERGRVDDVLPRLRERLADHLPHAVEPVIREMFLSGPLSAMVPFQVLAAGRHWGPSSEFDLVLLDESRSRAIVVEVKWTRRPVPVTVLSDLEARVRADPDLAKLECRCMVVSRCGFAGRRPQGPAQGLIDLSALDLTSAG